MVRGVDRPNIDLEVTRWGFDDEKRAACWISCPRSPARVCSTPPPVERPRSTAPSSGTAACARRSITPAFPPVNARGCTRPSSTARRTWSSRRTPSGWESTSRMSDSSFTRRCRNRSTPTTRRSGAAGRDGEAASAVLFYRSEDLGLRKYFAARGTDAARLSAAYTALADADRPLRARISPSGSTSRGGARPELLNQLVEGAAARLTGKGCGGDRGGDAAGCRARPRRRPPSAVSASRSRESR